MKNKQPITYRYPNRPRVEKIVEKHVTVVEDTFNRLKYISKKECRSMRTVLTRMINARYEEMTSEK